MYRGTAGPVGAAEIGLLPSPMILLGATGSVRRGPLAFVLWAAAGSSQSLTAPSGAGAKVSAAMIGVGACRGLFGLPFGPCLGVSAARVAGGGFGSGISPRAESKVLARAELGAEAVFERGFLGGGLAALAILPLQRPSFVVGAGEELFRPSLVGGRGEVSLFLRF